MPSKIEEQKPPRMPEPVDNEPTLIEKALAMVQELNRKYPPTGLAADKAFIDSLYED